MNIRIKQVIKARYRLWTETFSISMRQFIQIVVAANKPRILIELLNKFSLRISGALCTLRALYYRRQPENRRCFLISASCQMQRLTLDVVVYFVILSLLHFSSSLTHYASWIQDFEFTLIWLLDELKFEALPCEDSGHCLVYPFFTRRFLFRSLTQSCNAKHIFFLFKIKNALSFYLPL